MATNRAWVKASPSPGSVGEGVGPVGAVHDRVDADDADQGVDRAHAVGRRLVVDERVDGARGSRRAGRAARGAAARDRRARRTRSAAAGAAARPATCQANQAAVQLRGVRRERRPPAGHARRSRGRGSGVHEHRQVGRLDHGEQRRQPLQRGRVAQRGGGHLESVHPRVLEGDGEPGQVRLDHVSGRPDAVPLDLAGLEVVGQRVPGVQQRGGLVGVHRLDAERARQRQQGQVDAVGPVDRAPGGQVVGGGVDGVRRLAVEVQRPALEPRTAVAAAQRVDEGRGPQVLVAVDDRTDLDRDRRVAGRGEGLHIVEYVTRLKASTAIDSPDGQPFEHRAPGRRARRPPRPRGRSPRRRGGSRPCPGRW